MHATGGGALRYIEMHIADLKILIIVKGRGWWLGWSTYGLHLWHHLYVLSGPTSTLSDQAAHPFEQAILTPKP